MKLTVVTLLLVLGVAGCARHLVVPPEEVSRLNSPDWTVKSEPAKAGETKTR